MCLPGTGIASQDEFMKFLGKWMDLEGIILSEVTQSQKNSLISECILAQKLGIPKIQFAKHMKFKKKEDQSVDTSVFLEEGTKFPWKELQSIELRLKEGPSRDCPTQGSIP